MIPTGRVTIGKSVLALYVNFGMRVNRMNSVRSLKIEPERGDKREAKKR